MGQCEGCTSLCEDDESDDWAAGAGLMSAAPMQVFRAGMNFGLYGIFIPGIWVLVGPA